MYLKKALFLSLFVLGISSVNAQPISHSTMGHGYFSRGELMRENKNYVGSTHQLDHYIKYLPVTWSQDVESELLIALNEFELGHNQAITMLEDFIENHKYEPLAMVARAKLGDYYFYHGDYEQALLNYEQVREKALDDDSDENVLYRRAYCDLMLNNYDEAKTFYDKLSKTKQYSSASTFFNAYIDYANGRYPQAYDQFETVDRLGELGYQSQYYMCQILYKQGDYSNAVKLGESLIEDNQNEYFAPELNRIVGESYYRMGNNTNAKPYLERFLTMCDEEDTAEKRSASYMLGVIDFNNRDYQNSIANMSNVTDVDDAMTQSAYLYMGQSRLKSGDYNGAAIAFERAANMTWDRNVRETAFYNYAISQNLGGRTPFNKSIDMFEQFLNEYPNSAYYSNVENYLIDAYTATSDYDKALRSIANINNPSDKVLQAKQSVLYHKGVQHLRNNRPSDAASSLQQAVDMGNKENDIYNDSKLWLAEAQYQLKDYQSASRNQEEYLKAVTEQDRNYGIAQYNLGSSLFNQQQYDKSIEAFKKAIESNSLSKDMTSEAYNRIGDAYYYLKNFTSAVDNYSKAAHGGVDASSEYAMLRNAIIAGDMNQYDSKIAQLDELIAKYPNSSKVPEAMLEKGNAQVLNGDLNNAISTYSYLVKKYPNHPEAREAMLKKALTEKSAGNNDAAISDYWGVIERYPASNEAKTAAEDLKLIYAERGELTAFSNRLNRIEGAPRIDVKEVEKATFEAAETYYIENERINKLENYLRDFPAGAYVDEAKYYIGHYYYNKHDYDSALDALDDALNGNEDAAFAQRAMALKGAILLEQGHSDEAYDIYEMWATKATNEDNLTMAMIGMLRSARESQAWDNVVNCADDLLNSNANLSSEIEQEIILSRAIANAKKGKTIAAQADLATLASNTQSEAGAQAAYELAKMQFEEDDLEEAEQTLDNLIDSATPHHYWLAKGFILLCDIYHKNGNVQDAIETLRSVKENYPGREGDIFNEIDSRLSKWSKKGK